MEQLYIIGSKYSGKKTIKRILSIVDNNNNNTCFKSKMWDITCIDVYNTKSLISSLKYLTNYTQKNILVIIDIINYDRDLDNLSHILKLCCKLNIYVTFCITKIDLLLFDYCIITKINNIINSYIHNISVSYDLYKIVSISSVKYDNKYYNIFTNDDELCLCESLIYSSFYTYKKRIYDIIYSIPVEDTIRVVINEDYSKIICIINNYEYEAKMSNNESLDNLFSVIDNNIDESVDNKIDSNITKKKVTKKNKPNENLILKHFINIDRNNPIVVVYL